MTKVVLDIEHYLVTQMIHYLEHYLVTKISCDKDGVKIHIQRLGDKDGALLGTLLDDTFTI